MMATIEGFFIHSFESNTLRYCARLSICLLKWRRDYIRAIDVLPKNHPFISKKKKFLLRALIVSHSTISTLLQISVWAFDVKVWTLCKTFHVQKCETIISFIINWRHYIPHIARVIVVNYWHENSTGPYKLIKPTHCIILLI